MIVHILNLKHEVSGQDLMRVVTDAPASAAQRCSAPWEAGRPWALLERALDHPALPLIPWMRSRTAAALVHQRLKLPPYE